MNTREIVTLLSQKLDRSEGNVGELLEDVAHTLSNELAAHDTFRLPGLGTFGTTERAAHRWYDPRSHRFRRLPAHVAIFFHASGQLKRRLLRRE